MGLELFTIALTGTAAITFLLMLLPAAIELAHPKDAGPRLISDNVVLVNVVPLTNIEEEPDGDRVSFSGLAVFLNFIHNLEL